MSYSFSMNADNQPVFQFAEWGKVQDLFSLMLRNLSPAPLPPVMAMIGQKPDLKRQFELLEAGVQDAVEGYLTLFFESGVWVKNQEDVLFFARYRLQFARDAAELFAGLRGTPLGVAIRQDDISPARLFRVLAVELWRSAGGTAWQRLRDFYRQMAFEAFVSGEPDDSPRSEKSENPS